jgi:hypothetical protein
MQLHKAIDAMLDQMDKVADQVAAGAVRGRNLSSADQAAVNAMSHKAFAQMRQIMTWDKLEKIYIKVYSETFTADEIAGMMAFYSTPAGQSTIQKLPIVMQKAMALMQPMMREMIQSAQTQVKEYVIDLQAKHAGKAG